MCSLLLFLWREPYIRRFAIKFGGEIMLLLTLPDQEEKLCQGKVHGLRGILFTSTRRTRGRLVVQMNGEYGRAREKEMDYAEPTAGANRETLH